MPISSFQKQVLALLKANRSPDSYVTGGDGVRGMRQGPWIHPGNGMSTRVELS